MYSLRCKGLNFTACPLTGAQPLCITAGSLVSAYAARHWVVHLIFPSVSLPCSHVSGLRRSACLKSTGLFAHQDLHFNTQVIKQRLGSQGSIGKASDTPAIPLSSHVALSLHRSKSSRVHPQTVGAETKSGLAWLTNITKGSSLLCADRSTYHDVLTAMRLPIDLLSDDELGDFECCLRRR